MLPDTPTPPVLKNKTLLLDFRLASRVEEIARLAEAVDKALQERADLAFAVNLCLEELITNTIQHGLQGARLVGRERRGLREHRLDRFERVAPDLLLAKDD